MHIVHVFIHIRPDRLEEFKQATEANASASLQEAGVARFDFLEQADDPTRFVLVEAYRTEQDVARHKETAHYNRWRETVEPLMAEPRTRAIYRNLYPDDANWG